MEHIIEIKNLSKNFGSGETHVAALSDVSLEVKSGEIFGIIGLSGAGKSTLVRCINLLERPNEGKVLFHGSDLMGLKENEVGYCELKVLESNENAHKFWSRQGFTPTTRVYGMKLK